MADPSRRAFLDANVLRGSLQTDVLLTLAFRDEFQPRWNAEVMDEVRRNAPKGLPPGAIERRIAQMNQAFPQAMVERIDSLEQVMQADPKDKHVLAGAVHSNSTVLVTENIKDFNPPTTGPHAMPVQRLSKFLSDLTRENPQRMVDAMREMVGRNQREPNTVSALIDKMAKQQDLRGFAQTLNTVVPEQDRGTAPELAQGAQAGQLTEVAGRSGQVAGQSAEVGGRSGQVTGQPAEVGGQPGPGAGQSPEAAGRSGQAAGQSAEVGGRSGQAAGQSAEVAGQPAQVSAQGGAQSAAVDPQAKAASALAFDGVAGAGTKAPAGRQTGSQDKAQTTQAPKPPERER